MPLDEKPWKRMIVRRFSTGTGLDMMVVGRDKTDVAVDFRGGDIGSSRLRFMAKRRA